MTELTAQRLREVVEYNAETGVFTRRVKRGKWPAGAVVGTAHSRGYWVITVDGKIHKAHRLAWLYVYGVWPASEIDHINRIKTDNRIANLREASRSQNTMNRANARTDNKLGVLGVSQVGSRFIARIVLDGEQKYLGMHRTIEAASLAYTSAKQEAQS
jgi:hypothetical protein